MRFNEVSKILSTFLFYFSIILAVPLLVALYYQFIYKSPLPNSTLAFIKTIFVTLLLAGIFYFFGKNAKGIFYRRESILIVILIWVIISIMSALPFYFSNTLKHAPDAIFESISGLTTTGASVMCPKLYDKNFHEIKYSYQNEHFPKTKYEYFGNIEPVRDSRGNILYEGVEAVSKAILFWRSFIQWIGGIGIVLIFLTVLPALSAGGKFLLQAEMTGPVKDTITPRIKDTASILWKLYLGFTIIEVVALMITNKNMHLLDAFCITFSNLSTGGFSIRNNQIAAYGSAITEWIIIIFMYIGSINFALYFYILKGKFYKIYEPDFILFIVISIIGSIGVIFYLVGTPVYNLDGTIQGTYSIGSAITEGTFHAVSAQTSTGFAATDIAKWPYQTQLFMVLLMYIGGMSGSTAGGIKTSRIYILYKILKFKIEEIFRPNMIRPLKIGDKEITNSTSTYVLAFFAIVTIFSILGISLYLIDHIEIETAISSVACMLNNVGFAFGAAGPALSFDFMSPFSKILSSFLMLLGRLEFFIILLVLAPFFWKIK